MNPGLSSDDIVEDSEPERERTRKASDFYDRSGSSPYVVTGDDDDRDESEEEGHDLIPIVLLPEIPLPATVSSSTTDIPILPEPHGSPTPTPPSAQPSSRLQSIPSPTKVDPSLQDSLSPECPFKMEMRKLKECVICAEDWSEPGKKIKTKWTHLLRCDPSIPHPLLIDMVRAQLDSIKSLRKANTVARKRRSLPTQANDIGFPTSGSTATIDLTGTIDSHYFQTKDNANAINKKSPPIANQDQRLSSIGSNSSRTNIITTPRPRSPIILKDQPHSLFSPCRTPSEDNKLSVDEKHAEKPSAFAKFAYGCSTSGPEAVVPSTDALHQKKKAALISKRTSSKPFMVVPDCPIEGSEMKKLVKCLVCSEDWSKDRKVWKTKWKHIYACSTRLSHDTTVESLKDMIIAHIQKATASEPKSLLQSLTTKQRSGGRKAIKETTVVSVATEEGRERMKMRIEKVLASSDDEMEREEHVADSRTPIPLEAQSEKRESETEAFGEDDEIGKVLAPTQVFTTSNLGSRFHKYGVSGASRSGLSSGEGRGWFDAANRGDFLQDHSRSSDKDEFIDPSDDEQKDSRGEVTARGETSPTERSSFSPAHLSSSSNVNLLSPVHACLPNLLAPLVSSHPTQNSFLTSHVAGANVLTSPRKTDVVNWTHTGLNSTLRLRGGGGEEEGQNNYHGEAGLIVVEDEVQEDGLVELGSSPEIVDLIDSVEEILSSSSPLQIVSALKPVQPATSSPWTSTPNRTSGGSKSKPAFISISDDESDDDGILLINPVNETPKPSSSKQFSDLDVYEDFLLDEDEGVLRMDRHVLPGSPISLTEEDQIDLNKNRSLSSPDVFSRHSSIKITNGKGKSKAPVMPDYESWECKKLQNLVKSYGLRQSSSKAQLISLLVDVWKTLHPELPPDPETPGPSPSMSTSAGRASKQKVHKKRLSSENKELVVSNSAKRKKMKRITALLDGSEEAVEPELEQGSSVCAWPADTENVDSDLDNEPEQKDEDLFEIFHQMVLQDEELWLRLLRYEPVGFEEMAHLAYKHGARMKGWEIVLKRWMDSQCITYWNLEVTGGRQRAK
ncbi:Structure-specific endonuclease subunit Slx4 [Phaffia rhodozyma]|uniref:Structure-specific endonuclease subunit SLX4 n=1 Tax=Phaffia rhodozyma TaxID=264483 RepID=A0A0F7SIU5_PHARH|nr:Structure-specific endonuclease subunit Slx4 [Phaffia rhodozyma]